MSSPAAGVSGAGNNFAGRVRVAVEPVGELIVGDLLYERFRFGVAEFGLGLAFELRFGELDRHDRGQSFTHVIAGEVVILFFQDALFAGVLVHECGQRGAETLFVGAALVGVDRIRVGVHALGVGRGPLHGHFQRHLAFVVFPLERDDLFVDEVGLFGTVEVLDVVDESLIVLEGVTDDRAVVSAVGFTLVGEGETQALVQKTHLLKTSAQRFVIEIDRLEGLSARPEGNGGAGFVVRFALFQGSVGDTIGETLAPNESLATNLDLEAARQGVHHGAADTVQSTGNGIPAAAEFSTGVQHRQDDLNGRTALCLVNVDGDSATVVFDANGAVGQNANINCVAVPRQGFVDGVVNDLIDQVVQSARSGGSDIHTGSLSNGFQPLEDLDIVCTVFVLRLPLRHYWGYIWGRAFGRRFNCHLKIGS